MSDKKWVDIEGSIQIDTHEDTFNQAFFEWIESKGWSFAGVTRLQEEENKGAFKLNKMTLEDLLKKGNSDYAKNHANWMVIEVQVEGTPQPEIIINPKENFESKLEYYSKAYSNELALKNNPNIKIVHYDFVEYLSDYFES